MDDPARNDAARRRLALALDVPDLAEAEDLARRLQPWFGVAKIGLELYLAEGPGTVEAMHTLGYEVFADLKLHDIPTTVRRAARVIGRLGVRYLNIHAAGGAEMVAAGVEGFRSGATEAGTREPVALAVTVLTSEPDTGIFDDRLATAVSGGCDGVVCAASKVDRVKAVDAELLTVVPGVRPAGSVVDDQVQVSTPAEAIEAGADVLVLGRPVTRAIDPEAVAAAVAAEVSASLTPSG